MVFCYSSFLLTIRISQASNSPNLNWSWMFYWSTNVVCWHKPSPLSPIRTELLMSVLSWLDPNVTLRGLNFLTVVRMISWVCLENIPIYLLWDTILLNNFLILKDCVVSCSFPYTVHHVMEARFYEPSLRWRRWPSSDMCCNLKKFFSTRDTLAPTGALRTHERG